MNKTTLKIKEILCHNNDIENSFGHCNDSVRARFHPEIIDNKIVCIHNYNSPISQKKRFVCPRLGNGNLLQIVILLKLEEKLNGQKSNSGKNKVNA